MHTQGDGYEFGLYEMASEELPETDTELEQGLSGTALESVLGHAMRRPLLTPDEETELLERAKAGDEDALAHLVESNLRLVMSIARHYVRPGVPLEDLVQEGAIGLIKAIEHFDLSRGLRFSTYAVHWVRQCVGRAADAQTNLVRLPNHAIESLRKIERTRNELRAREGREPTEEEIASTLGMSVSKVKRLACYARGHYSLDYQNHDGQPMYENLLTSPEEADPETVAIERVWLSQIFDIIDKELTPRERWAIYRMLGFEVSKAPPDTRKPLSRTQVTQLERRALAKLRALIQERLSDK
ncbi:MAG: hypothetical protein C4336_08275 [Armatimonadota bacterium]